MGGIIIYLFEGRNTSETIHRSLEDINQTALMTATAMDQATVVLNELRNQTDILVGVINDLNNSTAKKSISLSVECGFSGKTA